MNTNEPMKNRKTLLITIIFAAFVLCLFTTGCNIIDDSKPIENTERVGNESDHPEEKHYRLVKKTAYGAIFSAETGSLFDLITEYNYDEKGNLIREIMYDSAGNNLADSIEYEYDEDRNKIRTNRLVSGVLDSYIVYEYNPENKLIRETEYNLGNSYELDSFINYTIEYAYDADGKLVSRQSTDAVGNTETTTYEYDNKGLLSKEVIKGNDLTQTNTYTYDDRNRVTKIEYSNGVLEEYTYSEESNLPIKKVNKVPSLTTTYLYSYDEFENLIKETIENSESGSKEEIYYEYVSIDDFVDENGGESESETESESENICGNSECIDEENWEFIYSLDVTGDYSDIRDLPTNYDKEQAQADGCFVIGAMVHNENKYVEFKDKYSNEEPAFLRIIQNTVEGDPIIIDVYYRPGSKETDEDYPPCVFVIKDDTRDKFAAPENRNITCKVYDGIADYYEDERLYWVAYRGGKEDIDLDSENVFVISYFN